MSKIKFLPADKTVNFTENMTILEIAFENNLYIPSMCEEGTCSTCMVKVLKGKNFLSEDGEFNSKGASEIKEIKNDSGNILSCITRLKNNVNDVFVEVMIYDE